MHNNLPSLKANVSDSLHFLMDINFKLQKLKNNEITEQEFAQAILKRSSEVTYISNPKHTFEVIEESKKLFDSLDKE